MTTPERVQCYRDYLTEAYEIDSGESRLLPEREHLKALIVEIDRITVLIEQLHGEMTK